MMNQLSHEAKQFYQLQIIPQVMDDEPVIKRDSTFPLFSKHFNTHPQDVLDYFQTMRRQMEDFIDAFKKRIDVEITYSKNLQTVSKALDKYIKPGTELSTSYICSAFKVQHEQRSRQAFELAESLKTEIETMCTEYLKNQTATLKKMEKDIKKFYKDADNYSDNHSRALETFQNINKEMEETIITKNIMRYTSGIPQDKKVKLIGKASESIKENKEYEKLYLNSVREYNAFVNIYNKQQQITQQLDQAETLLRDQVILQGDCLRKLIVAEVSMFKNIEYDLLNISKQMEYLDTQKDVEAFVQEQKNNQNNRILVQTREREDQIRKATNNVQEAASNCIDEKPILGKSMLSESIFYIEEEYFSWMLSNKRNKKLRELIGKVWKILKNEQTAEKPVDKQQKSEEAKPESNEQVPPEQAKQPIQQNGEVKSQEVPTPTSQQKTETPVANEQKSWQEELKETISTFKVMQPPNFLTPNQKKEKGPNHEAIYQNFMTITSTIALLWNSQQIDVETVNNKITALETLLSQHHLYRLVALIFIEEYRLQHEVIIKSPNNAKICGRIVRAVLKESQKKNDVFIIRGLLGLLFTFYFVDDKVKKLIYLLPEIYQFETWKRNDFWQAAIFQTTFEEMALFAVQKGQTPAQTILRQKNIIFSQLASYCHYMIMLSITSKNVRLTVGRYCRLYDMTEEQNKDLSKMINNTTKQYKQTSYLLPKAAEREKSVIGD